MEAPMVYPTAPFATQAHEQLNVGAPTAHTGTGENVESPGKAKAVLSKVKHNARKLKNKLKKVTGSNTAVTDHDGANDEHDMRDMKDFDDGAESYEDDEEKDDLSKPNNHQFKYKQLRSIGALDNQGDGSEIEVHGGVPVSTLADDFGTYWKRADDSAPISPYKSAGPPDVLQATPTEYRNYAASDDPLPQEDDPMSGVPHGLMKDNISRGMDKENNHLGSPSLPEVKPSNLSYHDPAEPHSKLGILDTASAIGVATPSSEDDALKPDPSFGTSSSPTDDEFAVMNEGVSTDRKLGVGPPPEEYGRSGKDIPSETLMPEFKPDIKTADRSYYEPAQPHSKRGVLDMSASDTDVPYPENLVERNPSFGMSTPVYDKIAVMDEDLSADRKLGVGLSSDEHVGCGEGHALDTSVPELKPEVKTLNLSDSEPAEPHSNYGAVETASPSDIDVSYPEDLVKPNPLFGNSASPTHGKIAVRNEDALPDGKLGVGLSTEEHSGSGKGNLLETSVPEFEELSGYREGSPSVPLEADELVYRPISDPELRSSLISPEPNAAAQSSGTGQCLDDSMRQSQEPFEKDLEYLPKSEVNKAPSKDENDNDISLTGANYCEQKPSFIVASEKLADREIGTAGDCDRDSWGKWSADKINNAKDVTVSGLIATDHRDESENSVKNAVDAAGKADEVPHSQNIDAAKPPAVKYENKDLEEEYYDPNEVKDNKFQEGFTLGNVEEDALGGTVAGSAIEKLRGLKETVQSSLGYSNQDDSGAGEDGPGLEWEERVLSPSSYQQQKGGFVQGLKETVASSLGYGKAGEDRPGLEGGERVLSPSSYQQQKGGFVQGLKESVASSLGYGKAGEDRPGLEGEERVLSPSSYQQQKGGFVQGLKGTVASSLGYGKAGSDEAGHNNDVSERGGESETDDDSRQQRPGGTYGVLNDVVASKLGYGPAEESPVITKKTECRESLSEPISHELPYNEGGDHQNVTKAGHVLSDTRDNADREDEVSDQPRSGGVLQGVKDRVISKLGYSSHPEETYRDTTPTDSVSAPPADQPASSYTQKLINTTAAARDYLSSRVGYGNSNEDKGEINFDDGEKSNNPSARADDTYNEKLNIASKLSPSDEDKALADLVTDKVSSTASMMGEKLRLSGTTPSSNVPDQPQQ